MIAKSLPWNNKFVKRIEDLEQLLEHSISESSTSRHKWEAISRSLAIIEFDANGTILNVNDNYLKMLGYSLREVVGNHHRMLVLPQDANSSEYSRFWTKLREGEEITGEFVRLTKSGKRAWLAGSYSPVFDDAGSVTGVVAVASDLTSSKEQWVSLAGQAAAVDRGLAVIEFQLDGTIIRANQNFLSTMGYSLSEIQGRHHSIFVPEAIKNSSEYVDFWAAINRGQFHSGEFHRIDKSGNDVFIQASYNPITGLNGEIKSVVKYAINITDAVRNRQRTNCVANSVAASVSQMTHTIQEISSKVSSTAVLARETEALSTTARNGVQALDEQSRSIGEVVETIRDLADQTNLLALNATIESARAGEAGRGFAVVASEVKELAKQTATATENIEKTVMVIRNSIMGVVDSTEKITSSVSNVSQNMVVISAAVEEQSVTMNSLAGTANELRQVH